MTAFDFLFSKNVDYFAYFKTFAKNTTDGAIGGMNAYMNKIVMSYNTQNGTQAENFNKKAQDDQVSELKKETYYNIKSLYDKVTGLKIGDSSTQQFEVATIGDLTKLQNISTKDLSLFYNLKLSKDPGDCLYNENKNSNGNFDLYKIFQVVDRGNNDISTEVLANLATLYNNLYSDFIAETPDNRNNSISKLTNYTIHNLLSILAMENGFLFQQIPTYLNLNGVVGNTGTDAQAQDVVDQLFGIHNNIGLFGDGLDTPDADDSFYGGLSGFPGYIFQLGSVTSTVSSDDDNKRINNNNLDSFCMDVKMNGNQTILQDESVPDDIKNSNVTSFTVDFGKQNQQMFTNIDIDTSQYMWTENAINTWVNYISSDKGLTQGANLFPVFEKISYTCTVNGLGNATIQPLSYFYLRNVPLFHGTYWITNVKHSISANNIMTTFKGVRQPIATKNDIRLELLSIFKKTADKIKAISNQVNTIVTEGIQDTGGIIRRVSDTGKVYPDFIQKNASGYGFTTFEGKTILGSYIYSISNDNDKSTLNNAIVAALYNSSKGLNNNTENHSTILAGMVDIAIGNMSIDALVGGKRYDDNVKGLSISKLFKLSGNGYNSNGDLSGLLDSISQSSALYKRSIQIVDGDKPYSVKINGKNGVKITKDEPTVTATLGTSLTPYNNFDLYTTNLFIEDNIQTNKSTDNYPALPITYTLADIVNTLSPTDGTISDLVTEVTISNNSTKVSKVRYRGTYTSNSISVSFFETTNNGIKSGVVYDPSIIKYYNHTAATIDELNQITKPKVPTPGSLKATYQNKVVNVLSSEFDKWNNGDVTLTDLNCSNTSVTTLLDGYWNAAKSSLLAQGGCSAQSPWSAAFISYVMKNSNVIEFPYATAHSVYIKKARDNKNSGGTYSWFGYDATTPDATVEVGDLLCYTRGTSLNVAWNDIDPAKGTNTHCDCVLAIDSSIVPFAKVIGGNVSNKVSSSIVYLKQDGTIDLNNTQNKVSGIYRGILKYQPKEIVASNTTKNIPSSINDLITAAGYSPSSAIGVMAAAIAQNEGYSVKTNLAYTNNNPGNLDYSDSFKRIDPLVYKQNGNTKQTSRFAVFSTPQLGMKALIETKIKSWANGQMPVTESNSGKYANIIGTWSPGQPPSFIQFFYTYAPPTDNNMTNNYTNNIVSTINATANKNYNANTLVLTAIS